MPSNIHEAPPEAASLEPSPPAGAAETILDDVEAMFQRLFVAGLPEATPAEAETVKTGE